MTTRPLTQSDTVQNAPSVTEPFFDEWLVETSSTNVTVFSEKIEGRQTNFDKITRTAADHFSSVNDVEACIERLGFEKSLKSFKNVIPDDKRTRSGDLGEILCTEYIIQKTDFRVPIRKLRYKDDRDRTMRGNDVLAFRIKNGIKQVLKAESKSRESLSKSVLNEAEKGLFQHDGRPNPSTLAFIQNRLRENKRIDESDFVSDLQENEFSTQNVRHLFFTLSGNAPLSYLNSKKDLQNGVLIKRNLVGIHITDHPGFVKEIFEGCINGVFRTPG